MEITLWVKGLTIGVLAGIPTGPVGIHCFNKSLVEGKTSGFIAAAGIACANTLLAFLILHGLVIVNNFMSKFDFLFRIIGAILFCVIGLKGIIEINTDLVVNHNNGIKLLKEFTTTFFAVVTNPLTYIRYSLIFACFGIITLSTLYSIEISLSVFLGIIFTWLIIILIIHKTRNKINIQSILKVKRILSGIIFLLGIAVFLSLFKELNI